LNRWKRIEGGRENECCLKMNSALLSTCRRSDEMREGRKERERIE
jgi:hypothetical protein